MLRRVSAVMLVLVLATPAFALDRVVWRHSAGHFENTVGNTWIEVSPDGHFTFTEVARTPNYIQLYDATRDCHVILTADSCMVQFGSAPYRLFYHGYWER
jgi:hypothetical protein